MTVLAGIAPVAACSSSKVSKERVASDPGGVATQSARSRPCRFDAIFRAAAELGPSTILCPAWLPGRARPFFVNLPGFEIRFRSTRAEVTFRTPRPVRYAKPTQTQKLPNGVGVAIFRLSAREVLAAVTGRSGKALVQVIVRTTGSNTAVTLARQITASLQNIAPRPSRTTGCPNATLFAALAQAVGAKGVCPEWIPGLPAVGILAGPGRSLGVLQFRGNATGLPHLVFEWTRQQRPPGIALGWFRLDRHHQTRIFFDPANAQPSLHSDHFIVAARTSAGLHFWVSLHDYYGSRRRNIAILLQIVDSLRDV